MSDGTPVAGEFWERKTNGTRLEVIRVVDDVVRVERFQYGRWGTGLVWMHPETITARYTRMHTLEEAQTEALSMHAALHV